MKVGVIGSGGREHAICLSLKNSSKIEKIFCFPGNAGTSELAENVILNLNDFENIKNFILEKKIDLIVVGPEKPLVDGLVDRDLYGTGWYRLLSSSEDRDGQKAAQYQQPAASGLGGEQWLRGRQFGACRA